MRRVLLALAALATMATTAASCLSPTLPLPPPDVPDAVSQSTTPGLWTISGYCALGATVIVTNQATGRGSTVEDRGHTGAYTTTISGKPCDAVTITQQTEADDQSIETGFVLQDYAMGAPVDPTACP